MAYKDAARGAIEKLRQKILGKDATLKLYKKTAAHGHVELATLTDGFFIGRETMGGDVDVQVLEVNSDDTRDALLEQTVAIGFKGRKMLVKVLNRGLDSANQWRFEVLNVEKT